MCTACTPWQEWADFSRPLLLCFTALLCVLPPHRKPILLPCPITSVFVFEWSGTTSAKCNSCHVNCSCMCVEVLSLSSPLLAISLLAISLLSLPPLPPFSLSLLSLPSLSPSSPSLPPSSPSFPFSPSLSSPSSFLPLLSSPSLLCYLLPLLFLLLQSWVLLLFVKWLWTRCYFCMHTKEYKIGLPYKECNVNLELWYSTNGCVHCWIHYTIFVMPACIKSATWLHSVRSIWVYSELGCFALEFLSLCVCVGVQLSRSQ